MLLSQCVQTGVNEKGRDEGTVRRETAEKTASFAANFDATSKPQPSITCRLNSQHWPLIALKKYLAMCHLESLLLRGQKGLLSSAAALCAQTCSHGYFRYTRAASKQL
jgi:hypothetical protein